jgi:hypothetical protein
MVVSRNARPFAKVQVGDAEPAGADGPQQLDLEPVIVVAGPRPPFG